MNDGEPESGPRLLRGRVQSGKGDAARWLRQLNEAYVRKLGVPVFPGSLNLAIETPFDWTEPSLQDAIIRFPREENGSERDILMLACRVRGLGPLTAFLWTTTRGLQAAKEGRVEIIAPVGLRDQYHLRDGDLVEIEIGGPAGHV